MNLLFYFLILFIPFIYPADVHQCTQLGIASYPLIKQAVEYLSINGNMTNSCRNASPEITAYIHELLEQQGVKEAKRIIIKLGKEYSSSDTTLIIEWLDEKSEFSLLESLIFQYNLISDPLEAEALLMLIYQQIGSIEHEISHIKNHDCKKRVLSLALFTAASWTALKLFENYFKDITDAADWKLKGAYSISSGFLLSKINKHFFYKICRNQERAADAMISDNTAILLAKVNLHTAIYETDKQHVEKKYGTSISWLCQKVPSLYLFFDWEHPTSYERAQTFAKRLVNVLNTEINTNPAQEI